MKKPAYSYEVSFFSALWIVFPESWKRRVADFYALDFRYAPKNLCLDLEKLKF